MFDDYEYEFLAETDQMIEKGNPKIELLIDIVKKTCRGNGKCIKAKYFHASIETENKIFCTYNCQIPKCKNFFLCNNYLNIQNVSCNSVDCDEYDGNCEDCYSKFNTLGLSTKQKIECPICMEPNMLGIRGVNCSHYHCVNCFKECYFPKTKKFFSLIEPHPEKEDVWQRVWRSFGHEDRPYKEPQFPILEKKKEYDEIVDIIISKHNIARDDYHDHITNILAINIQTKEFPDWVFQAKFRGWELKMWIHRLYTTDITIKDLDDYEDDYVVEQYTETLARCSLCRQDINSRKRDKKPWEYYGQESKKRIKL
jgi:hypothetical protein